MHPSDEAHEPMTVARLVTQPPGVMAMAGQLTWGWRASSMMGITFGRCLAMLTRSRPDLRRGRVRPGEVRIAELWGS